MVSVFGSRWITEVFLRGGDPSKGGGDIYRLGPKKLGFIYTFSAPKAPKTCFPRRRRRREKFLSTFFEIFGKFVNKNAIKSDFWGDLCRSISKIFEKSSFLAKKFIYKFRNFRKLIYRGGVTPLPKNRSGG